MNAWERRLQYLANLLVGGTGIVYAVMRYGLSPTDEWSVVNHPWQPFVQHAHVLTAPLLVFVCGLIWRRHVSDNWKREQRRRTSGPGLALAFLPMVLSGYLIQTTVTAGWRRAWIALHLVTSAAWLLALGGHLSWEYRQRIRARDPAAESRPRSADSPTLR